MDAADIKRSKVEECAREVLAARELFPGSTMADLHRVQKSWGRCRRLRRRSAAPARSSPHKERLDMIPCEKSEEEFLKAMEAID